MFTLAASSLTILALAFVQACAAGVPNVILPRSSSTINNCSGDVPPPPTIYQPHFSDYTAKIQHQSGGWETWTFALPGVTNDSLSIFTWARGDPASPSSNPDGLGTFTLLASHTNTSVTLKEKFVYKEVGNTLIDISIGKNSLVFDGSGGVFGTWNLTLDIDGLTADVTIVPFPPEVPFIPAHNGVPSQLVDHYFTNIPMTRGHSDGYMTYPTGEVWKVHEVTSIRHTWATKPTQKLVSSYTRGSVFFVLNALHWFQAKSTTSKVTKSAQLVVGMNEAPLDVAVIYQITDDSSLLDITTSGVNTTVTYPGCAATQNNPYVMTTFPIAYRGSLVDSAGGVTKYYSTQTQPSIWNGTGIYVGNSSLGVVEIYTSPAKCH